MLDREIRRSEVSRALARDRRELTLGHLPIRAVFDSRHGAPIVHLAHPTHEHHDGAVRRILHLSEQRADIDRAANDRCANAHPPATGGMIAISSPLAMR